MKVIIMYYIKNKMNIHTLVVILGLFLIANLPLVDFIFRQSDVLKSLKSPLTSPVIGNEFFFIFLGEIWMMENEWISVFLFLLFCKLEDTHAIICRQIFFIPVLPILSSKLDIIHLPHCRHYNSGFWLILENF